MAGERLDHLARALATGASRRDLLKMMAGGLAGGALHAAMPSSALITPSWETVFPTISYNGSLGPGSPLQMNRVIRDGVPSTCTVPKPGCPGVFPSGPVGFNSYSFLSANNGCINLTVNTACQTFGGPTPNDIEVVVYRGSFDPNNVCNNYLADMGNSTSPMNVGFNLGFGAMFIVVVHLVNAATSCGGYTLSVTGAKPLQVGGISGISQGFMPAAAPAPASGPTDR